MSTIISLCDYTGHMVEPWAEAGYECICVDTQHSIRREHQRGNIRLVWGDVRYWWPDSFDDVAAVFAFPPCTHLAVSGARDFKAKGLTHLIDALTLVEACRRICVAAEERGAIWVMENPNSRLSTLWRKWDYKFDPSDYAGYLNDDEDMLSEAYTKLTCLWTCDRFEMPEKRAIVPVLGSKMHLLPPGEDRANLRSATPRGFARAVFEANHKTARAA